MIEKDSRVIWDLPTRITHWALAICVILNLFILEEGEDPHRWTGYLAASLVGFRLFWGFKGGLASRFTSFPISLSSILQFLKGSGQGAQYVGHNPLASLTYLAIWGLVLSLAGTGFMMGLDAFWGNETLEEVHSFLADCFQVLIVLHLIGMTLDSFRYKRKTWLGMISGKK